MSTRIIHLYQFYKVRIEDENDPPNTTMVIQRIGPPTPGVMIHPEREVMVHFDHMRGKWHTNVCYAYFDTLDQLAKQFIDSNPLLNELTHHHHGMGGH